MPLPLIPLIAAGSMLAGQGINAAATGANNRKQRKWSEKMYERQRQDSLMDWNMQNEYNSPQSQMARLRQAGLNPNLVYGNGATATSSQGVRQSSVESYNPQPMQFDPGSVLGAYFDTQVKEAQIDNLKQQNTNMAEQEKLIQAQVVATLAGIPQTQATTERIKTETKRAMFDLGLAGDLRQNSLDVANQTLANMRKSGDKTTAEISNLGEQNKQIRANVQYTIDQNRRANQLQDLTLQKAAMEVLQMQLQQSKTSAETRQINQAIENLKKDERLKQLDIDMKKTGVQPTDELWQRVLVRILNEIF